MQLADTLRCHTLVCCAVHLFNKSSGAGAMDEFLGIVWFIISPMSDVVLFVRGLHVLCQHTTPVAQGPEVVQSGVFAMLAARTFLTSPAIAYLAIVSCYHFC